MKDRLLGAAVVIVFLLWSVWLLVNIQLGNWHSVAFLTACPLLGFIAGWVFGEFWS